MKRRTSQRYGKNRNALFLELRLHEVNLFFFLMSEQPRLSGWPVYADLISIFVDLPKTAGVEHARKTEGETNLSEAI